MKVFQVIPHLGSGGAERLVVDLCNQLEADGHTVTLCVLSPLEKPWDFYLKQVNKGVQVFSLNKPIGFSLKTAFKLTRIIRKAKPDVVHSHLRALPYTFIAESLFVKGVHTVHSEANIEAADFVNRFVRQFLFKTKRVIPVAVSPESFKSFQDYYGFNPVLVPNGRSIPQGFSVSDSVKSEFKQYRHNTKERVIVHLAHLDKVKRQVLHAKVAKRLFNEGYKFSVLFIGSVNDHTYTEEVRVNCPPCAFILGEKENPLEYLKEAGAFALTSLYEGLPISLIEALGVGAIPVCMPLGGIPDLIHNGENGILSDGLDEESFYHAEKSFLELDDYDFNRMRDRALASYAPYTMTRCSEKYTEIYKTLSLPNAE